MVYELREALTCLAWLRKRLKAIVLNLSVSVSEMISGMRLKKLSAYATLRAIMSKHVVSAMLLAIPIASHFKHLPEQMIAATRAAVGKEAPLSFDWQRQIKIFSVQACQNRIASPRLHCTRSLHMVNKDLLRQVTFQTSGGASQGWLLANLHLLQVEHPRHLEEHVFLTCYLFQRKVLAVIPPLWRHQSSDFVSWCPFGTYAGMSIDAENWCAYQEDLPVRVELFSLTAQCNRFSDWQKLSLRVQRHPLIPSHPKRIWPALWKVSSTCGWGCWRLLLPGVRVLLPIAASPSKTCCAVRKNVKQSQGTSARWFLTTWW